MLTLSQQDIYAQQQQVKAEPAEGFVRLDMPLEEALTKMTFIVPWISSDEFSEIVFESGSVTDFLYEDYGGEQQGSILPVEETIPGGNTTTVSSPTVHRMLPTLII